MITLTYKGTDPNISKNRVQMVAEHQRMVEESLATALFPDHNENADIKSKVIIDGYQPLPKRIEEEEVNTTNSRASKPSHDRFI
jgi:hypothetical protein